MVSFTSATFSADEGNVLSFEVELSEKVVRKENEATSVLVYYEILGTGTATSGDDFQTQGDYIQFRPNHHPEMVADPNNPGQQIPNPNHTSYNGDTRQTIDIQLTDDDLHELAETIMVRLTRATRGAVISTSDRTATGTINNTDNVTLSLEPTSALEGALGDNKYVPVTVRLDKLSTSNLTITWETRIQAGDTATAGTDFVAVSGGTKTINAGRLAETFNVQFKGDDDDTEDNESFTVRINSVSPFTDTTFSSGRSAKVTIKEDDRPVLTISGGSPITEGENAEFTITSTENPSGGTLSFNYTPVSANFLATGSETPVDTPTPLNFQASGSEYIATLSIATEDDSGAGAIEEKWFIDCHT